MNKSPASNHAEDEDEVLPEEERFLASLTAYRSVKTPEPPAVQAAKIAADAKFAAGSAPINKANKTIATRTARYGKTTLSKSGQKAVGAGK